MKLTNIFKRKKTLKNTPSCKATFSKETYFPELNSENTSCDNGDLPLGWIGKHRDFTEPIHKEYSRLLSSWIDARSKSPKELYGELTNFVVYIEQIQQKCRKLGGYYIVWCEEILLGKDYLEKRKQELCDLEKNLDLLQSDYERKQLSLPSLDNDLYDFLLNNASILQTDVYKHFDPCLKSEIQTRLYYWSKEGRITRIRNGRTYIISVNR